MYPNTMIHKVPTEKSCSVSCSRIVCGDACEVIGADIFPSLSQALVH